MNTRGYEKKSKEKNNVLLCEFSLFKRINERFSYYTFFSVLQQTLYIFIWQIEHHSRRCTVLILFVSVWFSWINFMCLPLPSMRISYKISINCKSVQELILDDILFFFSMYFVVCRSCYIISPVYNIRLEIDRHTRSINIMIRCYWYIYNIP